MKRALVLVLVAACHADLVQPWELDHDRVVAARATPPGCVGGDVVALDALVARAGAPTSVEAPTGATAANAPGELFAIVHFVFDHWEVQCPDDAGLAAARDELGLAADAPVPLDVTLIFGDLVATKRVWLGESLVAPALPDLLIDGAPPTPALDFAGHADIALAAADDDVRWFTSVGDLEDAVEPNATLHLGGAETGELAVVVRDGIGGVVWQVWPITVH